LPVTILDAMLDPKLFGPDFSGPSWSAWRTLLRAAFGLPHTANDLEVYRSCTGRGAWPGSAARELWCIAGRRAGKSRVAALVAVYAAAFRDYSSLLAAGERAVVLIVAADRRQARVIMDYVRAHLAHPMLKPLVEAERAEAIDLRGGVTIEVATASYRTIRGRTVAAAVLDEVSFWRDETSANPDEEIVAALRPALATLPGSLLFAISSPYSRRGSVFKAHQRYYGKDGDTLVWQAPSRTMNPTIPQQVVDDAMADDPSAARAEWLAEFRADLESYVDREAVERCVVRDRTELPPRSGVAYVGFADPSGGKSDSFTLCIAHREADVAVLDVLRERRPPFNPDDVVREHARLLRDYGLSNVTGDRYAAAWVEERYRAHGIRYERAPFSKSDYYVALLGQLNSTRVELPDSSKLVSQLCSLERRTSRGTGRDSVDHPPGQHDDLANVVAGAVHLVLGKPAGRVLELIGDPWHGFRPKLPAWWPKEWPAHWYAWGRTTAHPEDHGRSGANPPRNGER
jgi:hypothetical protein